MASSPKATVAYGPSMWPAEKASAGVRWHWPQSNDAAQVPWTCAVWAPTRIGSGVPPPRLGSPVPQIEFGGAPVALATPPWHMVQVVFHVAPWHWAQATPVLPPERS